MMDAFQLDVTVTRRTSDLVQMMVSELNGETCKVDLGTSAVATTGNNSWLSSWSTTLGSTGRCSPSLSVFLTRVPDREFEAYGVDKEYVAAMRAHFARWQHELGG